MVGFKLKHLGGGVQSHNAQASSSGWGLSVANKSNNKYSLAASQINNKKTNHLKGGYDYGGSSCTPLGITVCSITSLKYLHTNAHIIGNKQEELQICVWSQGHDLFAVTETWWDSSHD